MPDPLARSKSKPSLEFTEAEELRYSRHILLPQVGPTGQGRLRESKVLVIGAGGLGSPSLLYLAAAGVGEIHVCDFDTVELSNLQRQIAHTTAACGTPKTSSAANRMKDVNPDVQVIEHRERFSVDNAMRLVEGMDCVLDGCDNFTTRYLANDACFFARVPLISAAVFRFEGMLSVHDWQENTPCYRCLFERPPPAGMVPSCQEAGVLGAVVGVLGTLQAVECIKLLTGAGERLVGRMLRYDALAGAFMDFGFPRNKSCALCGQEPTIVSLASEVGGEGCAI